MIDFKGCNVVLTGAGGGVGGALVEVLPYDATGTAGGQIS